MSWWFYVLLYWLQAPTETRGICRVQRTCGGGIARLRGEAEVVVVQPAAYPGLSRRRLRRDAVLVFVRHCLLDDVVVLVVLTVGIGHVVRVGSGLTRLVLAKVFGSFFQSFNRTINQSHPEQEQICEMLPAYMFVTGTHAAECV